MQPFPSPMSVVERVRREAERNALPRAGGQARPRRGTQRGAGSLGERRQQLCHRHHASD